MWNYYQEKIFAMIIKLLALATFLLLLFILFFLLKESCPLFSEVSLSHFLFNNNWNPSDYTGEPSFGLSAIIQATIYTSVLGVILALIFGLGSAIIISQVLPEKMRFYLRPLINMLVAIPSVVYGFIGLYTIVKLLEYLGRSAGESILSGSIVLAVMVLPFIIINSEETMYKVRKEYALASDILGISKWYMIRHLILPASFKGILTSIILAFSRAMGETMAVMMVIGNAPIEPHLLDKGLTISSLIALDMGSVAVGSEHYHALFAAGTALLVLLGIINLVFFLLKKYLL